MTIRTPPLSYSGLADAAHRAFNAAVYENGDDHIIFDVSKMDNDERNRRAIPYIMGVCSVDDWGISDIKYADYEIHVRPLA